MDSASLGPPVDAAEAASGPMNNIPDHTLARIFAYLPLKDRFLLCLVSHGWAAVSQSVWLKVKVLDLTSIPHCMVEPIFDLCPKIRELNLVGFRRKLPDLAKHIAKLPKLDVLIYASKWDLSTETIGQLITSDSALRILIIAGDDSLTSLSERLRRLQSATPAAINRVVLPARPLRDGFPPLHVFIGGEITNYVLLTVPQPGASVCRIIDCPLPVYLAKSEVAEIFEGVWLAKVIREGPANGLRPWASPSETRLFYSQVLPRGGNYFVPQPVLPV